MRETTHVAIVTGGASGIGLATCRRLAKRGVAVVVADINGAAAESAAAQMRDGGQKALGARVDVARREDWLSALKSANEAFGAVDILVSNAGIIRDRSLLKMTDEEWDAVLDVNLKGAWIGAQCVFGAMKAKKWGRICMTSSMSHRGNFGQANYAASKAGLTGLVRTIAVEGARSGILVNAVAPNTVNTPIITAVAKEIRDDWLSKSRIGRFLEADEIAAVIDFLVSDDNTVISGQLIEADAADLVGATIP